MDIEITRHRVLSHHDPLQALMEIVIEMFREHDERITMAEATMADLKTKFEKFATDTNTKIQALVDAANNTTGTVPSDVQAAINDLAAEMDNADALLNGGTGETPTGSADPEQPSQTV